MLVKCKCCGDKIDRDFAFNIPKNGKNNYYCSQAEYLNSLENKKSAKQTRGDIFNTINEIFGKVVLNTILFKEIDQIRKIYTNEIVLSYLKENQKTLENLIQNKTFFNEYAQIRYFAAILKNNLSDYQENMSTDVNKENFSKQTENNYKESDVEFVSIKFKRNKTKKSLSEYENEEEDGDDL